MSANVDSFVGREAAWHKLGIVVDHDLTPQQARKLAFDWEPEPFTLIDGRTFDEIETHKGIARSDNGKQLAVVAESYGILGNDVITELAQATGLNVSTAGALGIGERVWMLLEAGERSFGDDEHKRYIWIASSHDASASLTARPTNVRVVCQNTWQMALRSSGKAEVRIRHSRNAKSYVAEAKRVLAQADQQFDQMDREIEWLLRGDSHAGERGLEKMVNQVFGEIEEDASKRQITNWDNRFEQIQTIYRSETVENIKGTNFGSVMAINEWELKRPGRGSNAHEAEARRVLSGLSYTAKAAELAMA